MATPTPAEPILASNLYTLETANQTPPPEVLPNQWQPPLKTSSLTNDFNFNFTSNSLNYITTPSRPETQDLLQTLLTTHLLSSKTSTATVIDSTLDFDVRKLHNTLKAQIKTSLQLPTSSHHHHSEEDTTLQHLSRVKISKIFDLKGLIETISEVQAEDSHKHDFLLLIITNLTNNLLLSPSYVQTQATFTSLMRLLDHLCKTRNLCVVVFGDGRRANKKKVEEEEERLSMFESCGMSEVLGGGCGVGGLVDGHLYLHKVLRRRRKRETGGGDGHALVLEVVQDRYGDGYGQWVALEYDSEGRLKGIS
ncbi:uncharacterized protein MYCFIDRAFT_169070 [Pseudocercospora fijiensis CIRAD86]|uniref:DNA recombination and repair protein Rad51-like C-terminal domain-containing protein n=1 Tax=Pseudocercospora fijiensis (strain CIRAD86) TaxID=383855 RepID=N1Q6X6_PSEFD|nr:uncharacterized protein MYCFIDRAFT_169070 [Pseudocercospora fijiensis CIRAD86]EME87211.1 hypothetical protein MYCFIDRAFT_169070 [Pseudocercospora fijiensis CIRAD86]